MTHSPEPDSKKVVWISNTILYGGITLIGFLTIRSDHKLLTIIVGGLALIIALTIAGMLLLPKEEIREDIAEETAMLPQQQDRDVKPEIMAELADFPTFGPDEIEYDTSIPDNELEEDTLLFDSTGHGIDLEEDLHVEGLWVAFELLDMDHTEWSMRPWGYEMLFAIEAIVAAGGQPSRSRELGRMRSWGKRVQFTVKPELARDLLSRIDFYVKAICENPEGRDFNPDALEQLTVESERMKKRVKRFL